MVTDVPCYENPAIRRVPSEAIFHEPEGGQPFTYVQTPSGWERREVELELVNNIGVAVHSGLSRGEVVAVDEPLV